MIDLKTLKQKDVNTINKQIGKIESDISRMPTSGFSSLRNKELIEIQNAIVDTLGYLAHCMQYIVEDNKDDK